jgi:hypothetical protein
MLILRKKIFVGMNLGSGFFRSIVLFWHTVASPFHGEVVSGLRAEIDQEISGITNHKQLYET